MGKKIKNGVERLEFIVGANIDDIKEEINKIVFPDTKEIFELRYGLKDGKEYTIDEIVETLNKKEITSKEIRTFKKDKKYAKKFGIELELNVWTPNSVIENIANTLAILIQKFHPKRFEWPGDVHLEDIDIKSEKERLMYILGVDINKGIDAIDNLLGFQIKEIIEMRYGLKGKEYTLKEIEDKLNSEKITLEDRKILEKYKEIELLYDIHFYQNKWSLKDIMHEESIALLRLRQHLLN